MRCLAALPVFLFAVPAYPQARFEVASIRPSPPDATVRDGRVRFLGNRFEATARTVGDLLDMLGGYELYRVVGGPEWMRTDRYDIQATADRELQGSERTNAVMALLADRFQLKSHKETRDVPAFVLRILRMPPGLKRADDAEKYSPVRIDARGDIVLAKYSMPAFANYLSQMLPAPVVDETGLKEMYDFALPMSQVSLQTTDSGADRVREAAEAFGFRIEDRKIPLEVTVIDRCERPSEN